jgi:hypothetical protein
MRIRCVYTLCITNENATRCMLGDDSGRPNRTVGQFWVWLPRVSPVAIFSVPLQGRGTRRTVLFRRQEREGQVFGGGWAAAGGISRRLCRAHEISGFLGQFPVVEIPGSL